MATRPTINRESANPQSMRDFQLANRLIAASKLDKAPDTVLPTFTSDLSSHIITALQQARKAPDAHDDDRLIRIAGHTCTIESLQTNVATLLHSIQQLKEAGESDEDIRRVAEGYYRAIADTLAYGFDKIEEKKLVKDAAGNVIAITEERLQNTECAKALLERKEPLGGRLKRTRSKKRSKKRKTLRRTRH